VRRRRRNGRFGAHVRDTVCDFTSEGGWCWLETGCAVDNTRTRLNGTVAFAGATTTECLRRRNNELPVAFTGATTGRLQNRRANRELTVAFAGATTLVSRPLGALAIHVAGRTTIVTQTIDSLPAWGAVCCTSGSVGVPTGAIFLLLCQLAESLVEVVLLLFVMEDGPCLICVFALLLGAHKAKVCEGGLDVWEKHPICVGVLNAIHEQSPHVLEGTLAHSGCSRRCGTKVCLEEAAEVVHAAWVAFHENYPGSRALGAQLL